MMFQITRRVILAVTLALLGLMQPQAVHSGSPIVVTSRLDDKTGDQCPPLSAADITLRCAIQRAANGDVIQISAGDPISLNLSYGDLRVEGKSITINGPSNDNVTIGHIPSTGSGGRILRVGIPDNSASLEMHNVTITGGHADQGGGIYVDYNSTLKLYDSIISGNTATNRTFNTGYGGGIAINQSGTVEIYNSTISDNEAWRGGGLITANNPATLKVYNSTVARNSATYGGGIYNFGDSSILTLANSTVSGNSAVTSGGGIGNDGQATVTNSTISGNSAHEGVGGDIPGGGGIANYANSDIKLTNTTVSGNSASTVGGGILREGGHVTIANTIVAGNTAPKDTSGDDTSDCAGAVLADSAVGHNLLGTGCPYFDIQGSPGNLLNVADAKLDSLSSNSPGTTQTMALLTDSPAIGKGDTNTCQYIAGPDGITPDQDQRGSPRNSSARGVCDIGAYDTGGIDQTAPLPPVITSPKDSTLTNSNSVTVSGTAEVNSTVELFDSTISKGTTTATEGKFTFSLTSVADGAHTYMAKATDAARNTSPPSNSVTIQIDTIAPTITAAATAPANGNGWYHSDVIIRFTCSDTGSGIAPGACPADEVLSAEGSAVSSTAQTVTDQAGNKSAPSKVVIVNIDKTPPTIAGSASPTANANGWNNGAVTVSFTCTDALSGIATCTDPRTLSSEGANQEVKSTATDKADNTATQVTYISIDLTAPIVSVTGVTNGTTYTLGTAPAPGCKTTDALSGVQTEATVSVTGGNPNSNGVGKFTATCKGAIDKAGNAGNVASVTYKVTGKP